MEVAVKIKGPYDCMLCFRGLDRGPSYDTVEEDSPVVRAGFLIEKKDGEGEPTPLTDYDGDQSSGYRHFFHILRTTAMPCCFAMVHLRCVKIWVNSHDSCPGCDVKQPLLTSPLKARFIANLYLKRAHYIPGPLLDTSSNLISRIFRLHLDVDAFLKQDERSQRTELSRLFYGREDAFSEVLDSSGIALFRLLQNPWELPYGRMRNQLLEAWLKIATFAKPIRGELPNHLELRFNAFFARHVQTDAVLLEKLAGLFTRIYPHIDGEDPELKQVQDILNEFETSFPGEIIEMPIVIERKRRRLCERRCNRCTKVVGTVLATLLLGSYILFMVNFAKRLHLID